MFWLPFVAIIVIHLGLGYLVEGMLMGEGAHFDPKLRRPLFLVLWVAYMVILIMFCEHALKQWYFHKHSSKALAEWVDETVESKRVVDDTVAKILITAYEILSKDQRLMSVELLLEIQRTVRDLEAADSAVDAVGRVREWITALADMPNRMSVDSADAILALVKSCRIPPAVDAAFVGSLRRLAERMNDLTNGRTVSEARLTEQYQYAAGVARHYKKVPSKQQKNLTVLATALDSPSEFYGTNAHYFYSHQDWPESEDGKFKAFWQSSAMRVRVKSSRRARLVVIAEDKLRGEYAVENFWSFIRWHFDNAVDLRFMLIGENDYRGIVNGITLEPSSLSIDDFIVYGDESVFGRVDLQPDESGHVKLRLLFKDEIRSSKYRECFKSLWNDPRSKTLWELAGPSDPKELVEFQERLNALARKCEELSR